MTLSSPKRGVKAAATALGIVLATASCAEPGGEAVAEATASPPSPTTSSPAREAPEAVLERVKADLASQEGVPVDSIDVVTARGVVWKDAAMGCGEPGKSYALVRIEGFLIVLEHGDRQFEYRTQADGPFVLCRGGNASSPRQSPQTP